MFNFFRPNKKYVFFTLLIMYKKIKEYGCIYLYFKILDNKKKRFERFAFDETAWKFFFNIENGHVYTIFIRPLKEMLYVTAV